MYQWGGVIFTRLPRLEVLLTGLSNVELLQSYCVWLFAE